MKKTNLLVLALSALLVTSCGAGNKSEEPKSEVKSNTPTSEPASNPVSEQPSDENSSGGNEQVQLPEFNLAANVVEAADGASDYAVESAELYNQVFGQFYLYNQRASEATSKAEKYALQAIAEAKLMETGALLPGTGGGGNFAISRVVPYSISPVQYGNDSYRYHNALVATDLIKSEDRDAIKGLYKEYQGTGQFETKAREYMVSKGYTLKDSYTLAYTSDPTVYDIHASYYAVDAEPLVNTFDGLLEYDGENTLQPALATGYEVSADGKEYTFTIREGASWVDKDGNKVADVTADDFVAGFQHMLDAEGGLEGLTYGLIENAFEYSYEKSCGFEDVGVKAVGNKVTYTLCEPADYFVTMLGYSIFAPLSRSYYTSKGGKFGAEYDPEADDYHYAEGYDSIAYCGPYLIQQYTKENTFVFQANESYWNKDNINIKNITWLFNDGSDNTKAYNDCKAGTIDGAALNTAVLPTAKQNGDFDNYAYISTPDANTYPFWFNLNRQAYANYNDETAVVSLKTDAEKALSEKAFSNPYFRFALCMSVDRKTVYSTQKAEEIALNAALNTWTPAEFVTLPAELTIAINGENKTYPEGTMFGQIVQDQLDADGFGQFIKVFDPTLDGGLGSGHGFDGWYNPDGAKLFLEKAVEELAQDGVNISKDNPVVIEYLTFENDIYKARAQAFAQSIEASTDGLVKVKVNVAQTRTLQLNACYYADLGSQMNYDIADVSGWGPDYGDPKTYLDCFLPQNGGMAKCAGIY